MFWAGSFPTKSLTYNFSSLASTLLPFYFGSRQHSWSPTDSETSFSRFSFSFLIEESSHWNFHWLSARFPHLLLTPPILPSICSSSLALPPTWCVPPYCCHCKRFRIRRPSSLTCVSCQRFTDMETCYLSYLCPLTILALPDNFRLVWQPANGYTPLASFHNFQFCQNRRVSLFDCTYSPIAMETTTKWQKNCQMRPKFPNGGSPIWQKFPHFPFFFFSRRASALSTLLKS